MTVLLLSGEVALRMGCILSVFMIVGIVAWSMWNTLREGVRYLKRLHQVPCSRCVYFTGDHRLKCPVHPIIALTEDAIACRDYEARAIPLYPITSPPTPQLSLMKPISASMAKSSKQLPYCKAVVTASSERERHE